MFACGGCLWSSCTREALLNPIKKKNKREEKCVYENKFAISGEIKLIWFYF